MMMMEEEARVWLGSVKQLMLVKNCTNLKKPVCLEIEKQMRRNAGEQNIDIKLIIVLAVENRTVLKMCYNIQKYDGNI